MDWSWLAARCPPCHSSLARWREKMDNTYCSMKGQEAHFPITIMGKNSLDLRKIKLYKNRAGCWQTKIELITPSLLPRLNFAPLFMTLMLPHPFHPKQSQENEEMGVAVSPQHFLSAISSSSHFSNVGPLIGDTIQSCCLGGLDTG